MSTIKPSDDWISRLILIIQECKAETGENSLDAFLDSLSVDLYDNTMIIRKLKQL